MTKGYYFISPIRCLSWLIIVSPFAGSIYLRENFLDIRGAKPIELLTIIVIVVSLINFNKSSKLPKFLVYYSLGIFLIYTICFIRSIENLNIFNALYYFKDKLTTSRYVNSYYIKPLISFLPLIIIPKFAKNKNDLYFINNVILFTLILLSIQIIYLYLSVLNLSTDQISDYYQEYFAMHRNNIASFYVIGLPIAFANYYNKKKFYNIFLIILIFIGIGLNFSRAAYFTSIFALFLYVIISKRIKMVPFLAIMLIFIAIIALPESIQKRATVGLESKNPDSITAGRIDNIWVPLIKENILGKKRNLIFGKGRYSIQASEVVKRGDILHVAHPHSMFIEVFIDAGIIGFIVFITFYYKIVSKAFHFLYLIKDPMLKEYHYAYIVSIICFLVSGLTDRSFFPTQDNMFIFIILACTIVICNNMRNLENEFHQVIK